MTSIFKPKFKTTRARNPKNDKKNRWFTEKIYYIFIYKENF